MIIGIDASNIRSGGGVTHLVEFLSNVPHELRTRHKYVVWGGKALLESLNHIGWVEKRHVKRLDSHLLVRIIWQIFSLPRALKTEHCDLLFSPGGLCFCNFRPFVTVSQNLLPFEIRELVRFGFSVKTVKLILIRFAQLYTFRRANGIIFLTTYARDVVLRCVDATKAMISVIPHGVNKKYIRQPKLQTSIEGYTADLPFNILYVSTIDEYKHQWNVAEAVCRLIDCGYKIKLTLVGDAYPPSLVRLKRTLKKINIDEALIQYKGVIPYDTLHLEYDVADLVVFASSCENLPIILLESMASGNPIACSNMGPMKTILRDGGCYFDPLNIESIMVAIESMINDPCLRQKCAEVSSGLAREYTWESCAIATMEFLNMNFESCSR